MFLAIPAFAQSDANLRDWWKANSDHNAHVAQWAESLTDQQKATLAQLQKDEQELAALRAKIAAECPSKELDHKASEPVCKEPAK